MERQEDSYIKGEKVIYREDNMILLVEILQNNCDLTSIDYKLKVIKTIAPHYLFGKARVKGEFNFSRARNVGCGGLSKIIDISEEEFGNENTNKIH